MGSAIERRHFKKHQISLGELILRMIIGLKYVNVRSLWFGANKSWGALCCLKLCRFMMSYLSFQEVVSHLTRLSLGLPGLYSLSGKTSYRQISWSLEATRLDVIMVVWLWNLTGTSAAALPKCLLNFRAIGKVQTRISRLRDFTRSYSKTSYRLVNRGPERQHNDHRSTCSCSIYSWCPVSVTSKVCLHKLFPGQESFWVRTQSMRGSFS